MGKLPAEIKMTFHAQQRLEQRNLNGYKYNTKNIMRSACRWYGKDDLIHDCALYRHCCYTCRKSNQIGYITDGEIEVIYNKGTKTAITVLEVKEKFKPITQYIKPELLKKIETRKDNIKMSQYKFITKGICTDCGKEEELNSNGICIKCVRRQINAKNRGKEYVRYLDLTEKEKSRIDIYQEAQAKKNENKKKAQERKEQEVVLFAPDSETYYQSKAEQKPVEGHQIKTITVNNKVIDPLQDQFSFIKILQECGCEIPENTLKEVLNVLLATDKLKDLFTSVMKTEDQRTICELDDILTIVEKKLRYDWEFNGFQELDDIKYKGFLTWRRVLKDSIFFWKKLCQADTLNELQRAWSAYTSLLEPTSNTAPATNGVLKRFQITTESISTIFNTKRPFTRVFYAQSKEEAYDMFVKWMTDRQLHENKAKTTIVELKQEGEEINGDKEQSI